MFWPGRAHHSPRYATIKGDQTQLVTYGKAQQPGVRYLPVAEQLIGVESGGVEQTHIGVHP